MNSTQIAIMAMLAQGNSYISDIGKPAYILSMDNRKSRTFKSAMELADKGIIDIVETLTTNNAGEITNDSMILHYAVLPRDIGSFIKHDWKRVTDAMLSDYEK